MLKKTLWVIVVLFLSCGWHAGIANAYTANMLRYDNALKHFSILLPAGWQMTEGYMGLAIYAVNTAGQQPPGENISVAVESLPYAMSLTEYSQLIFNGIQHYFSSSNYQNIEQGEETIRDVNSHWMLYSYSMGAAQFDVLVYCFVQNNYGYIVTGCAPHDQFPQYRQTFEASARSLEIIK